MADDLSFTISAEDQASRAVETVQKKIQSFGTDVAKLALGVAGPMAALQAGIGYVSDKWAEYKKAQADAFEAGAKPVYDELKAQQELGLQLDKNLSAILAIAKIKQEQAKTKEDVKTQEGQAREAFINSEAGQKFVQQKLKERGLQSGAYTQEEVDAAAKAEGARILAEKKKKDDEAAAKKAADDKEKQRQKDLPKLEEVNKKIKDAQQNLAQGGALTGEDLVNELSKQVSLAQRQYDIISEGQASEIEKANALLKLEEAKIALRNEQTKQSKEQADAQAKLAKDAEALAKKEAEALAKNLNKNDTDKLTVSSLREIGGSFGGGDVSTGIERQVELAQKQIEVLGTIASNTAPKPDAGKPADVGQTNFTSNSKSIGGS